MAQPRQSGEASKGIGNAWLLAVGLPIATDDERKAARSKNSRRRVTFGRAGGVFGDGDLRCDQILRESESIRLLSSVSKHVDRNEDEYRCQDNNK